MVRLSDAAVPESPFSAGVIGWDTKHRARLGAALSSHPVFCCFLCWSFFCFSFLLSPAAHGSHICFLGCADLWRFLFFKHAFCMSKSYRRQTLDKLHICATAPGLKIHIFFTRLFTASGLLQHGTPLRAAGEIQSQSSLKAAAVQGTRLGSWLGADPNAARPGPMETAQQGGRSTVRKRKKRQRKKMMREERRRRAPCSWCAVHNPGVSTDCTTAASRGVRCAPCPFPWDLGINP